MIITTMYYSVQNADPSANKIKKEDEISPDVPQISVEEMLQAMTIQDTTNY